MRLQHLEVVWALARSRGMREAARRLGVTQPAVSQALRRAEDLIGVELFFRDRKVLVPTPELRALMPEIERIFGSVEEIRRRSGGMGRGQAGRVTIAAIPTLTGQWLAEAALAFRRQYPRMTLRVLTAPTDVVTERILAGQAEIALLHGPVTIPGLQTTKIADNRIIALLPRGHPLAGQAAITPRDLRNYDLITMSATITPGERIAAAFAKANTPFAPAVEISMAAAAALFVRAGAGVALVDANAVPPEGAADLVTLPFLPRIAMNAEAAVMAARPLPPAAAAFLGLLRQAASRRRDAAPVAEEADQGQVMHDPEAAAAPVRASSRRPGLARPRRSA